MYKIIILHTYLCICGVYKIYYFWCRDNAREETKNDAYYIIINVCMRVRVLRPPSNFSRARAPFGRHKIDDTRLAHLICMIVIITNLYTETFYAAFSIMKIKKKLLNLFARNILQQLHYAVWRCCMIVSVYCCNDVAADMRKRTAHYYYY